MGVKAGTGHTGDAAGFLHVFTHRGHQVFEVLGFHFFLVIPETGHFFPEDVRGGRLFGGERFFHCALGHLNADMGRQMLGD